MLSKFSQGARPHKSAYEQLDGDTELSILAIAGSNQLHTRSALQDISQVPTEDSLLQQKGNFLSRRFPGWKFGAFCAALLSLLSLALNIGAAVWLAYHTNYDYDNNLVNLYRGDCSTVEKMNTYIHFIINVLSTLLLSGSNYAMQCLVAPTRDMIDKAHAKGEWLDIGMPSIRNLRSVSVTSVSLWVALLLSSVPLHLVYNSAVYGTIGANDYSYRIATQGYFDTLDFNNLSSSDQWAQNLTNYERLDNADCLRAYAKDFVEDRADVVVIVKNSTNPGPPLEQHYTVGNVIVPEIQIYRPYSWLCGDSNSSQKYELPPVALEYGAYEASNVCYLWVSQIEANPQNWALGNDTVDHCLSQRIKEQCGLNVNMSIIITVIVCNAIKCAIMLYVAFGFRYEPLIVIGDAVASFLHRPDSVTKEAGLLSRKDVVDYVRYRDLYVSASHDENNVFHNSKTFQNNHPRRFTAASKPRWVVTTTLCVVSIIVMLVLLFDGISNQLSQNHTIAALWNLGFGKVNAQTLISGSGWSGRKYDMSSGDLIFTAILVANVPQLILSILYFNLNGLITSVCLAAEWARFATTRKSLRVSIPKDGQRSTHFLTIPYRYGIPMLIISTILHWLVSQSLFLAVVTEVTNYDVTDNIMPSILIATCGYSPIAIIFGVVVSFLLVTATVAMGFPRLSAQIPLVGSCSLAISAACHPLEHDKRAAFKPIMWGAVPGMVDEDGVRHCTFSSEQVQKLEVGVQYR